MTDIKFPEYESIIPNQVFGRESKFGINPSIQLMKISKYRFPTPEDKAKLIRTQIHKIYTSLDDSLEEDTIAVVLRSLFNSESLEELFKENPWGLDLPELYSNHEKLRDGSNYVSLLNGIRSRYSLDYIKSFFGTNDPEAYGHFAMQTQEGGWLLNLELDKNNKILQGSELELLLSKGFYKASTLEIRGKFLNNEDIKNQIRILLSNSNFPDNLEKIRDTSNFLLETKTIYDLATIANDLRLSLEKGDGSPKGIYIN